jgi:hypothetical protein
MKAILKSSCLGGLLCGLVLTIAPKTQAQDYSIPMINTVDPAVNRVQNETYMRGIREQNSKGTTPTKIRKTTLSNSGRAKVKTKSSVGLPKNTKSTRFTGNRN